MAHKPIFTKSYLNMKDKLNYFYGGTGYRPQSNCTHKKTTSSLLENYGLDSNPSLIKKPAEPLNKSKKNWSKLRKQYNNLGLAKGPKLKGDKTS